MSHRALLSIAASRYLGLFSPSSNAGAPARAVLDLGPGAQESGLVATGLMQPVVGPVVQREFEKPLEKHVDDVMKHLGGKL